MKRLGPAVILLAGALTLTGCGTAQSPRLSVAKAEAASTFMQTEMVDGLTISLSVAPLQVGENHLVATVSDPKLTEVEAQVVMATMGHGKVVDLTPAGPGRFEATTGAIEMNGRWIVRIRANPPGGGEAKDALFHLNLP